MQTKLFTINYKGFNNFVSLEIDEYFGSEDKYYVYYEELNTFHWFYSLAEAIKSIYEEMDYYTDGYEEDLVKHHCEVTKYPEFNAQDFTDF